MLLTFEFAVIWFVIAVIVFAIQGQLFRIAVSKSPIAESFEGMPFLANRDPASAIMFEDDGFRVVTTVMHRIPTDIKFRFAHAMSAIRRACCFMGAIDFRDGSLDSETSARIRLSLNKCISLSPDNGSAGALTFPICSSASCGPVGSLARWANDCEISKYLVS